MAGWLREKLDGLAFRYRCWGYGILFGTSKSFRIPDKLKLKQGFRKFIFNRSSDSAFEYEFRETCLTDSYHLQILKHKLPVSRIVDIGANQGLFLLAARKNFPEAAIDGYEPNPDLQKGLIHNANLLNARIFPEAVSGREGFVDLQLGESDLETRTVMKESGTIKAVSLAKVINRIGGSIDILKMDCEGAEWEILEDTESFSFIRSITMEYHLWAKQHSSVEMLIARLNELDFSVISTHAISDNFGLLTALRN